MSARPRVALVGTGGTITAIGRDGFDLHDYDANGVMVDAAALLGHFPDAFPDHEVVPVPFRAMSSTDISFPEWKALLGLCASVAAEDPGVAGIVVLHGTATLEETAYFLNLTSKVAVPIVLVGSQRPLNGHSSDALVNLRNAVRVAADPTARGMGVLVLLNDEVHAAREVTKSATYRLDAFRSPDFGVLGHADPDAVRFYRRPSRVGAPDAGFDVEGLDALPRVDVLYAYAGGDGILARAALAAGARGIVSAGFAPGAPNGPEGEVLREAVRRGVVVVQSTRAGSGRVGLTSAMVANGFLSADNLNPQKARILLSVALASTDDPVRIAAMFARH